MQMRDPFFLEHGAPGRFSHMREADLTRCLAKLGRKAKKFQVIHRPTMLAVYPLWG